MKPIEHKETGHSEQLIQVIIIGGFFVVYFYAGLGLMLILAVISLFDWMYEWSRKKWTEYFVEGEMC